MVDQISAGRTILLDRAGWRNVIGRDAVTQQRQHARTDNVLDRPRLARHALEVWRVLDISGRGIPLELIAGWRWQCSPEVIAIEHASILVPKHLRFDRFLDDAFDLVLRRPDVLETDRAAIAI